MAREPERVDFEEFALHLRTIFDTMARQKAPVLVIKGGEIYRLELEEGQTTEDVWAAYAPEQVQRALQTSAGALSDVDREALLSDIHKQRKQAGHGHRS